MISLIKKLFPGRTASRETIMIAFFQFSSLALGLVSGVVIARTLGPAEKGIIDLFNLVTNMIAEFGSLGFGSGLLYYFINQKRKLGEAHGTALVFSIAIGVIFVFIGLMGLRYWRIYLPNLSAWMIILAFALAMPQIYRLIWSNLMVGINRAVSNYILGFIISALSLSATIVLWLSGYLNSSSLILTTFIFIIGSCVPSFYILYRQDTRLTSSGLLLRQSLMYGLTILTGIVANTIHFKVDQFIINYSLGSAALGIYALSVRWAEMLFLLDTALIAGALFKISSLDLQGSFTLARKTAKTILVVTGLGGLVLALVSKPLMQVLYGRQFVDAAFPLVLLIPGIIAWSVSKIFSGLLVYNLRMATYVTKFAIFGCILNVVLNYSFIVIGNQGIIGAAIASSISYILVALIMVYKCYSLVK